MAFMVLGFGFALLPLLFRLALKLRLGIPLLYSVLMLTVFHGWYQAHAALADGILFAMVGLAALSWMVTLVRKLAGIVSEFLENMAAAKLLASRVRQARLAGESIVSTDGLPGEIIPLKSAPHHCRCGADFLPFTRLRIELEDFQSVLPLDVFYHAVQEYLDFMLLLQVYFG